MAHFFKKNFKFGGKSRLPPKKVYNIGYRTCKSHVIIKFPIQFISIK